MQSIELTDYEKQFLDAYITAITFTEGEDHREYEAEFIRDSAIDCMAFLIRARPYLSFAYSTPDQDGHDFWLTRNSHGSGFWDRDSVYGGTLSKIAESFGHVYPVLQDD